ncbi:flagellar basal body L-ring protein FlgH [Maritimibacter sp. HL-12]|uniref:flagellar basal body L-ring protein FlgH n=1 Tax=Maritimibacter sp. HL-12 TaxID=1162418 RepID=UPI000A0F2825|nr:flagellar basal body L-ring protein FlgH [Maritimibacter sp. HL-12]SMH42897.1 flagellar L-ring protein precursor FlgH [Maritimibacter sp. HL-12]
MKRKLLPLGGLVVLLFGAGCEQRLNDLGRPPGLSEIETTREAQAMSSIPLPRDIVMRQEAEGSSLWAAGRQSLLGDRRAQAAGDILTVVIEIDEQAEVSASSSRGRSGAEEMRIGALLGIDALGPLAEIDLVPGVSTSSSGSSSGNGTTRRNEKLTLRVAATVVGNLPNGVLRIEGSQEVRVNYELRELLVSGYVRPADISRQNEIPYDKIASARISYGGRGQITDMQQPRIGQQITDMVLPF